MGCGNSSAASTAGGQPEAAKGEIEDTSPEDEKRKNYGGVYVGLPADLTNNDDDIITGTCAGQVDHVVTFTKKDNHPELTQMVKHPVVS